MYMLLYTLVISMAFTLEVGSQNQMIANSVPDAVQSLDSSDTNPGSQCWRAKDTF